ncbi:hypothetical protein BKA56DRAFT_638628 [Ilyonectria sp. MPI-CAGE-AT-0026]|nr:hypothetical protein BKA56DRAFT_638628 [Ilyonectria sp. MPI-CAGE-AT-0026]
MDGVTFDSNSNTRVILDISAQFAREWLSCYEGDEHTHAAIFFNNLDEIVMLDRSGKVEELQTSLFSNQLDRCLVVLDEAHTRGTDLKLLVNYQAAVTLGANLIKDRLVQACVRMRKLGKGQTVDSTTDKITVSDVLCWVITETWFNLRRAARQFMEDEAQSFNIQYRLQQAHSSISSLLDRVESHIAEEFDRRCQDFRLTELRTSSPQEEQERELLPETEQERQIERPPPAEPAIHHIHPSLVELVIRGLFLGKGIAFNPAFKALSKTSAANHLDINEFPHNIWVTRNFATTVKGEFGSTNYSDSFQQPVHYILTYKAKSSSIDLIIISPYEA